ncbi:MAG: SufD family Fe-S cluster assembly protein [Spirochaetes bacterium]|nr:SufD family Fe-S cluster assembly protein [Spirochaetota bacterium]
MNKVWIEAQEVFNKLLWPEESWESWRRTPLGKVRPEQKFQQFFSVHKEGFGKSSRITENGKAREGWALEVHRTANTWVCYRSEETQQVELYDWFSNYPPEVSRVLMKRIQGLSDRIQAWNLSYPTHGLILKIPDHLRISSPLLLQVEEEDVISLPHLVILLGKDSEAQIVVRFDARKTPGIFFNGGITYQGEENAQGTLVVDRLVPSESGFFLSFEGYLQRDASLQSLEVHAGGQVSKSNWKLELEKEGSRGDLRGAYVATPGSHLEMELTQSHRSGHSQSNSLYKGVIASGGKSVFQGLIVVGEGATKTDAYLANRNLLLGSGARADSIPRLVIGNNDVRCTHGSTTGKLNELQLFYLRSRGIPYGEARRILIEGFFEEVISKIPQIYQEDVVHRIAESLL